MEKGGVLIVGDAKGEKVNAVGCFIFDLSSACL